MRFLPALALLLVISGPLRAADDAPLLGASEAAFVAKYGQPKPYKDSFPPITKAMVFKVDFLVLTAQFVDDRCVLLSARNTESPLGEPQVKQILDRCGGEWKPSRKDFVRADGSVAKVHDDTLYVITAEYEKAKAASKKQSATRPIKGL